jgi:hypothetical protein
MNDCQNLVNAYMKWLKDGITIKDINGICEITTPFLDRHNDHLQIYIKKSNDRFILTDDGYTIADLQLSGCEFTSEKRRRALHSILNGFGVSIGGDELFVEARDNDLPQKKHNLIQAMLSINDLFVMATPIVAGLFREDVERYLRFNEIRFTPSVSFTGKSKLVHLFDFVIPASKTKPERIMKAINRPSKQNIMSLIFSWTDTRETRASDSVACGVLNDSEQPVKQSLISALEQYDIKTLTWSQRDRYTNELAA